MLAALKQDPEWPLQRRSYEEILRLIAASEVRVETQLGKEGGGAGSRIPPDDVGLDLSRSVSAGSPVGDGSQAATTSAVSLGVDPSTGRNVESRPDVVRDRLCTTLAQWITAPDVRTLRRALLEILSALE